MQNIYYTPGLMHEHQTIHHLDKAKFEQIIRYLTQYDFWWTDEVISETGEPIAAHHPQYQLDILEKLILCHMGEALGLGVFAKESIPQGSIIGCYAGQMIPQKDIHDTYTFVSQKKGLLKELTLEEFQLLASLVKTPSVIQHANEENYHEISLNATEVSLLDEYSIPQDILDKLNQTIYVSASRKSNITAFIQFAPTLTTSTYQPEEQAAANILTKSDEQGIIWLSADRNIEAGEQLTLDYGYDFYSIPLKGFSHHGQTFAEQFLKYHHLNISSLLIHLAHRQKKMTDFQKYLERFPQFSTPLDEKNIALEISGLLFAHPDFLKLFYPEDRNFIIENFDIVVQKNSVESIKTPHPKLLDIMDQTPCKNNKQVRIRFNREKLLSLLKINNPLRVYCIQEPPYPAVSKDPIQAQRHPLNVCQTLARRYIEKNKYELAAGQYELALHLSRDHLAKRVMNLYPMDELSDAEWMMLLDEIQTKMPNPILARILEKIQQTPPQKLSTKDIQHMLYFLDESPLKQKIKEPVFIIRLTLDKQVMHHFPFNEEIFQITQALGHCYYHLGLQGDEYASQYLKEARYCFIAVQTMAEKLRQQTNAQEMLDNIEAHEYHTNKPHSLMGMG